MTSPASIWGHVRSANVATPGFATMASLPLVRSLVGFGRSAVSERGDR